MLGLSRRALYRRLERLDLSETHHAPPRHRLLARSDMSADDDTAVG